jgi:RNA polymerase sigma-70 factor (ECF subfamily)
MHLAVSIVRSEALAEDLSQTIFVKAWQALPKFDGRAALSTWLYTIARNTCLTALRAESYRRTAALDETAGSCPANPAPVNIAIEQCVARLPDVQREVIMLYYFQDRDVAEVAAMLDLPEGTVKSHLHRARRALGAMME